MRCRLLIASLAFTAGACSTPRIYGAGVELQTLIYGGYRALAHSDFDGHPAYAFELATNDTRNAWGYEIHGSHGDEESDSFEIDHEARFNDLSLGLRRTWAGSGNLRTVLGFGGALTRVANTIDDPTRRFTDEGGAAYGHAALHWIQGEVPFDPGTDVLIGVDLRVLVGDDYDYAQLALVLGFGR